MSRDSLLLFPSQRTYTILCFPGISWGTARATFQKALFWYDYSGQPVPVNSNQRTPMTAKPLQGKRVLSFVGDIYEDLELWYPKLRLIEAGAEFVIAGEEAKRVYAGKNGYPCASDIAIADAKSSDFDAVLLPGGFMPDRLRRLDRVKQLISEFAGDGKCVAAICHGGWLAISAGVYRGVRTTGSPGIKDDLVNAGAIWEDAPVVVDRHFVSSRKPDDLPWFAAAMIDVMVKKDA
jgi:protease I